MGATRLVGNWSPALLGNAIAYYDARYIGNGAITTWSPVWTNGWSGGLTGTGTGNSSYVQSPRFISNNSLGMASSTPWGFWAIFRVDTLGDSLNARFLLSVTETLNNGHGMLWYNYSGNVMKIFGGGGTGTTIAAAGIAQKTAGVDYLAVVNYPTADSGQMFTRTEDGTSTAITAPTYTAAAKFYVGRDYTNQNNSYLVGRMYAFGLTSQNISGSDIALLRSWAQAQFGIAA